MSAVNGPPPGADLRVAMSTFGYLYSRGLEESLRSIADAGFRLVEIAPSPPHLFAPDLDRAQRRRLGRLLSEVGLECCSLNPPDLNLISPNPDLRETARRHYEAAIDLASDLGAPVVVVIAGRQSPLIPMPASRAEELASTQLAALAESAAQRGVKLAVETVPFGFNETAGEVAALVGRLGSDAIGVALDVANLYGREDLAGAVAEAGSLLLIAHLSDTWRDRWAHTSIGRGEVDFPEFLDALRAAGFRGSCVYELVDGEDPDPRLRGDLETLSSWGLAP